MIELIAYVADIFLHLDKHLSVVIQNYGTWTYLILFLVIFCETGFVVTPFLPGDSLLFAAGTFAALGSLDVVTLFWLLCIAATAGNIVNYQIGLYIGPKVFHKENSMIFRKDYIERTHRYYEKYGGVTLVIARFLPIIRTFAPFLAGVGKMTYMKFTIFNLAGCLAWISLFVLGGYFFGNLPFVRNNFSLVIVAIIVISVLPTVIEILRRRKG